MILGMERPERTRACSLKDLRPDFAAMIRKSFSVEEEILACYETTGTAEDVGSFFGARKPVYSAQVISAKRLVLGWVSDNSNSVTSIQLSDVVSVKQTSHGNNSYWVRVSGHGEESVACAFAVQQMSQDFAIILQKAIEQEKSASENQHLSLANIEERIETLTRLHKNGLITDTEFQEKRKELLNKL